MGAKIGKPYDSAYDLLRGEFPDDPEFAESFLEVYKKEEIANILWMMRTHRGVSQAELAKRLGVSQSKISKIEDHGDSVKFNDVVAYVRALGFNTFLEFKDSAASGDDSGLLVSVNMPERPVALSPQ